MRSRERFMFLQAVTFALVGSFGACAVMASAFVDEIASRAVHSGVPHEGVTLRSVTAPATRIDLVPTAKQFERAVASSKYAPSKPTELAAILGVKQVVERGAAPRRVGSVFSSGADADVVHWEPVAGGAVAHFRVTSTGAKGIRAKLVLPLELNQGELRVVGRMGDPAEVVPLHIGLNGEVWTPFTEGATQIVEIFTAQDVAGLKFNVKDVVHFEESPWSAKDPAEPSQNTAVAGTCTVNVACAIADDPVNGNAIAERRKSVARMLFNSGGGAFLCTGTLINSPAQLNFFLTANHCISTQAEASSLETRWFYENAGCTGIVLNDAVSLAGGAQLVFTNQFVDSTLLRLNSPPPNGAIYAGWNSNPLIVNSPVVSLSHPKGDLMKVAIGTMSVATNSTGLLRLQGYQQQMYGVLFSRGIIEGGSSGSGLFTLTNGSLQLRGVLSSSTLRNGTGGMSCTNTTENANYARFDYLYPQIAPILNGTAFPADDVANQPSSTVPLLTFDVSKTATLNYVGDIDSFRINVTQAGTLYVKSGGGYDLIGGLLDANGTTLETDKLNSTNDDADSGSNDFGITWPVTPGTYYLNVAPWVPTDLTPNGYNVTANFTTATTNYSSMWWAGASESGWGLNLNHQGNTIFGSLFTYDAGKGIWLYLSNGARQPDGSYLGTLYQNTGSPFNAVPFTPVSNANITPVGSMRLTFSGPENGTLVYTAFNRTVTKNITKLPYATQPVCGYSGTNRTFNDNYQDLWWNPAESGWGLNISHQSDTIFASLFNYGLDRNGMWLFLSNGAKLTGTANTDIFSGDLLSATGPNFDAVPFTAITGANTRRVGNMRLEFTDGNTGKLIYDVDGIPVTKNIERLAFDTFRSDCQKP